MEHYINLLITSVFIENMALSFFLGMCTFLAVSKKIEIAIGITHDHTPYELAYRHDIPSMLIKKRGGRPHMGACLFFSTPSPLSSPPGWRTSDTPPPRTRYFYHRPRRPRP